MSDKYKKEIEEILKQADEVMPKDQAGSPPRPDGDSGGPFGKPGHVSHGKRLRISPSKLMLASFGLLLLGLILGAVGIGNVVVFVVAGLVLFVIAYALFFVRPGRPSSSEKRWRGRIIDHRPTLLDQFKQWLRG